MTVYDFRLLVSVVSVGKLYGLEFNKHEVGLVNELKKLQYLCEKLQKSYQKKTFMIHN